MNIEVRNLFQTPAGDCETFETLLSRPGLRLERIISRGDTSPEGFWYDQETDEWVALIAGEAELEFERSGRMRLRRGDFLMIPAKVKHRVVSTSPDAVWLALHLEEAESFSA